MRKLISLALVLVCAYGWFNVANVLLHQDDLYEQSLQQARAMAERGVPYQASRYYGVALDETLEQDVYREYLAQLKALNNNESYYTALAQYLAVYPTDTEYYEILLQHYYDRQSTASLLKLYQTAKSNNAVSETMTALYEEVFYTVVTVTGNLQYASDFVGNYAIVNVAGASGIINSSGQTVVPAKYEFVDLLVGSVYPVVDETGSYLMNLNGEAHMRPSEPVDYVYALSDGVCVVMRDGKYGMCGSSLNIPAELPYEYLTTSSNGLMAAKKDGKWALITNTGEKVTDFIYEDILIDEARNICIRNGVVFAKQDGKYIMLDAEGKRIGTESFDEAKHFASASYPTAVRSGSSWGFVNINGTMNGEYKFDEIDSISKGMYPAKKGDKWGYKSIDGKFRIEAEFDEARPFAANGIAAVRIGDTWKYITLKGFQQ